MPRSRRIANLLLEVYNRLFAQYGPQGWWPSDGPFETVVGAVLTQNTAWVNVDKALANLRAADAMSPAAIRAMPESSLAELVRPSGYFNTKAKKLKAIAKHLASYDDDLERWRNRQAKELRAELLSVYGIGPETADDIVLYAADLPSFVIDAYTQRILNRVGVLPEKRTYEDYQALFEDNLPHEATLFNEYHALLDAHAKLVCRKRAPDCAKCVLRDLCREGQERYESTHSRALSV